MNRTTIITLARSSLLLAFAALSACADAHERDGLEDAGASDASFVCPASLPTVDQPCPVEDASCGSCSADACSFCNIVVCREGVWQRLEVHPAPCHACGPLQCPSDESYCEIDTLPESAAYECVPLPTCDEPSCDCVEASVSDSVLDCIDERGEVTLTIVGSSSAP